MAARAILGEWLGGSGGGWQDSGGVWPGIKLITGVLATPERPRVGRQPRAPPARPPHPGLGGGPAPHQGPPAREPGARARRDGPERGPHPGDGDGALPAAGPRRVGRPAGGLPPLRPDPRPPARGRRAGPRRRHHAQLQRPHPDHHPLGHQPLHRDPDRRRAPGPGRGLLGLLDAGRACPAGAWASSSIPGATAPPRTTALPDAPHQIAPRSGAPLRHGARGLRPGHQRAGHLGPHPARRGRPPAPGLLRPGRAPPSCARTCAPCAPRGGRSWTASAPPAAPARSCPVWCRPCSTASSPAPPAPARGSAPWAPCWTTSASTGCSTSRSATDLRRGRISLAQNRLPASTDIRDVQAGDVTRPGRDRRRRRSRRRRAARPWSGARWRW